MVEKRKQVHVIAHTGSGDVQKRVKVVRVRKGDGPPETIVEGLDDLGDLVTTDEEDGTLVVRIKMPGSTGEAEDDPLPRAAAVTGAIDNLEGEVASLVRRARAQGYTWTQIGAALGITKQAAWERFSGED